MQILLFWMTCSCLLFARVKRAYWMLVNGKDQELGALKWGHNLEECINIFKFLQSSDICILPTLRGGKYAMAPLTVCTTVRFFWSRETQTSCRTCKSSQETCMHSLYFNLLNKILVTITTDQGSNWYPSKLQNCPDFALSNSDITSPILPTDSATVNGGLGFFPPKSVWTHPGCKARNPMSGNSMA